MLYSNMEEISFPGLLPPESPSFNTYNTMASSTIRPDIFEDLLARHFKTNREYGAEDIKVLEITGQPEDDATFVVKPDEVRDWLSKVRAEDTHRGTIREEHSKSKIRVMFGSGLIGEFAEYIGRGVLTGHSTLKVNRPFLREDYNLVEQTFRFPRNASLLLTGVIDPFRGHFTVSQTSRDNDRPVFGLTLYAFCSLLVGIKASTSLSYDPSTGQINALVLIASDPPGDFGWLEEDLRQLRPLATNPFLLPTLICQRHTEAIVATLRKTWTEFHQLEISSGQTDFKMVGVEHLGRCDDPRLPVAILGVLRVVIAIKAYIKVHIITVNSIKHELEAFPWDMLPDSERARAEEQNKLIVKHLDWIITSMKINEVQVEHLRQRADVQATAINNILAQRDNETNRIMVEASTSIAHDTRRDSSAMKSIAILTLIFLPATFTATYFSTPAVVALGPSQGFYWAITSALTVVVILAWITFFYGWVVTRLPLARGFKSTS
ncbi:hypothetical protein F4680DRAFT_412820 [Xylaria scruposa]|nr:hypothetical protein F4680DRAFT_412820 [Xylaria scruposa]